MKTFFLFVFSLVSLMAMAQEADSVYTKVDIMPRFPGGKYSLSGYLSSTIAYPESAKNAGKEGTVYVSFVVGKTGIVSEPKIVKGFDEECDNIALKSITSMPNWIPGQHEGKPVRVMFTLPVEFKLSKNEEKPKR